ncbi:ABC transporter permease [Clostridium bowmanii]|uniref:ABC transporter permease n=1 Tax=Clostridium bowmanii TaxID=132925 RepID=UPI001C0D4E41|nr:ABC transporter permease [Clostridium bowmanii]MBU3188827.1 ABC transporter permease [Clostridium bowmanii]MCA1073410.1 ABC transporter permease [Clostridium bowmanii]
MKNLIKQVFHSPKFVVGFVIFIILFFMIIFYPLFITADPLDMIGGLFNKPGTYVAVKDVLQTDEYILKINTSSVKFKSISVADKQSMADWLIKFGNVKESETNINDGEALVNLWQKNYSSEVLQTGLLNAEKMNYVRLNNKINKLINSSDVYIASKNSDGVLESPKPLDSQSFVNTKDIVNKRNFILGTDNFGRDVLTELVAAMGTSLKIGLVAGTIATFIGLILGLLAGYVGGTLDDFIMFITNIFTVIPSFILLVLISFSVGESARGVMLTAAIIGFTSWPWTTRSVRSQVISLRNRNHVNLSKLSGHSLPRIILTDILPYVASYVVMAFILQISSGILAEAQLSMIGLGPATTKVSTLGLMLNWAMAYKAPLTGAWWAFLPVILAITLISFSLNLMNTGLDQVFNPQLRD